MATSSRPSSVSGLLKSFKKKVTGSTTEQGDSMADTHRPKAQSTNGTVEPDKLEHANEQEVLRQMRSRGALLTRTSG